MGPYRFAGPAIALGAAAAGNLFDSVLGATIQRRGLVTNGMVNLVGTSVAGWAGVRTGASVWTLISTVARTPLLGSAACPRALEKAADPKSRGPRYLFQPCYRR